MKKIKAYKFIFLFGQNKKLDLNPTFLFLFLIENRVLGSLAHSLNNQQES